jgi:hypothetical protein
MKTLLAPRASTLLYELLRAREASAPFLLPANICPIVPITFLKAGVPFEFVDIAPGSLGMDLDQVWDRLRQNDGDRGGLLYGHTYGDPDTPWEFFRALKESWPHLLLIDDRCLCEPDLVPREEPAVDVTLYSTGYAKIVDIGFGGYAFAGDYVSHRHISLPFTRADLTALEAGYKASLAESRPYRYHDSNWLETDSQLPTWDDYAGRFSAAIPESLAHRTEINAVYNSMVPVELRLPERFQVWRYNVRHVAAEHLLQSISAAGLFASRHHASLAGIFGSGIGVNAAALAGSILNLFNDFHYTLDMAERTARIVSGMDGSHAG